MGAPALMVPAGLVTDLVHSVVVAASSFEVPVVLLTYMHWGEGALFVGDAIYQIGLATEFQSFPFNKGRLGWML